MADHEDPIEQLRGVRFEANFGRYSIVVMNADPKVTVDHQPGVVTTTSVPHVEIEIRHWDGVSEDGVEIAHAWVPLADARALALAVSGAAAATASFFEGTPPAGA